MAQIVIGHSAYGRVGPNVFCRFNHIDDRIDRQDNTHDADGSTDGRHERKRQEVAAHGHASIANGGEDGDEEPNDHRRQGQFKACILHEEEAGDEDESSTAIHVDCRADWQYEARYLFVDAKILFRRCQRYRQCAGRALCEEGYGNGRRHLLEYVNRIKTPNDQEEGQYDEELDDVAA